MLNTTEPDKLPYPKRLPYLSIRVSRLSRQFRIAAYPVWSHWLIFPKQDIHQLNILPRYNAKKKKKKKKTTSKKHYTYADLHFLYDQRSYHIDSSIIPKYDVHPLNGIQGLRQNRLTMKYTSLWPTFMLRLEVSYQVKGRVTPTHYPKVWCPSVKILFKI